MSTDVNSASSPEVAASLTNDEKGLFVGAAGRAAGGFSVGNGCNGL